MQTTKTIDALTELLSDIGPLKVAVSGGVDSMTLAILAARALRENAVICHAISAAVQPEATERVKQFAALEGWQLKLFDAGEFDNVDYLKNPHNRCFYCKSSLYLAIEKIIYLEPTSTIVSGTNKDDLSDYRPGLVAAEEFKVRHPFVECGIDKAGIRSIAHYLGFPELSKLPASPCLSSRIETGLPIQAEQLSFVRQIEQNLQQNLQPSVVRCRIKSNGIAIQLDDQSIELLHNDFSHLLAWLEEMAIRQGLNPSVQIEPYQMGSAFVLPK